MNAFKECLQRIGENSWPIVYSDKYNIGFFCLEKLHPFDSKKWARVVSILQQKGLIQNTKDIVTPPELPENVLAATHTASYLESLRNSNTVAAITEVPPVSLLPSFVVNSYILTPMKYHVSGTILASMLAVKRGWAINIGGGFHHASRDDGGGFCVFADITMAIEEVRKGEPNLKVLIVDLDAHQGNGHERDFKDDPNVSILDVFNQSIYPGDFAAREAITFPFPIPSGMGDEQYLKIVKDALEKAFENNPKYGLLFYNAGTDVLDGDPLGHLRITPKGVIKRDELVFSKAKEERVPIVMVTSGGYTKPASAEVIAGSILNLYEKGLLPRTEDLSRGQVSSQKQSDHVGRAKSSSASSDRVS